MNAQKTVSEIIYNASSLGNSNFENLYQKLSILKLQREGKAILNETEATLLNRINNGFDQTKLDRLRYLDWKLEYESLTPIEEKESLKLAEEFESFSVERIKYMSKLATLRQISIDELIVKLGFQETVHG
jgi:hypothetical protein